MVWQLLVYSFLYLSRFCLVGCFLIFCKDFFLFSIAFLQLSPNQGLSIFGGTVEVLGMFFSAMLFNLAVKRVIVYIHQPPLHSQIKRL